MHVSPVLVNLLKVLSQIQNVYNAIMFHSKTAQQDFSPIQKASLKILSPIQHVSLDVLSRIQNVLVQVLSRMQNFHLAVVNLTDSPFQVLCTVPVGTHLTQEIPVHRVLYRTGSVKKLENL